MPSYDQERDEARGTAALRFMLEAWDAALEEGVDPDLLANAALYAALTGLVQAYGREAVAALAAGLPERIREGEFSTARSIQ
jgi:hypothetical protein